MNQIKEKETIIMVKAAATPITYTAAEKKESFKDKFLKTFRENQVNIICGILSMNGAANIYSVYKSLAK